jgi:hypothetical protein
MLLSSDAGFGAGAAGARRDAVRVRAVVRGAVRRRARLGAAARRTVRLAIRFAPRLVDRFAVFFVDAFLLDDLRDFPAVFAVFRRFLAMARSSR